MVHFYGNDWDADIQKRHGDAAPHGAAADDRGAGNVLSRSILRHIRDLGDLAFGKEHMNQRFALRVIQTLGEALLLYRNTCIEVTQIHRGFNALHDHFRRETLAHFSCGVLSRTVKDLSIVASLSDNLFFISDSANWTAFRNDIRSESKASFDNIALRQMIRDTHLNRSGPRDWVA